MRVGELRDSTMRRIMIRALCLLLAVAANGIYAQPPGFPENFKHVTNLSGGAASCESKILAHNATMIKCWVAELTTDETNGDVCKLFAPVNQTLCSTDTKKLAKGFDGSFYEGFVNASPSDSTTYLLLLPKSVDESAIAPRSMSDAVSVKSIEAQGDVERQYIKYPSGYRCAKKKDRLRKKPIKNIGSLKNCQRECDNRAPDCTAVNWDSEKKFCYLYTKCKRTRPTNNMKLSVIVPENENKFVKFPKGYNCDVQRVIADGLFAKTYRYCEKLCLDQADCRSFVWVRDTKSCYLKQPCDGGDLVYKDPYHFSGSRAPGTDNEYYYIDLPENYRCNDGGEGDPNKLGDEITNVDSFGDCKNICNYNEYCRGLSFNSQKNTCQLYTVCEDFNYSFVDESAVVHYPGYWLDLPSGWNLDCTTLHTVVIDACRNGDGPTSTCFEDCKNYCEYYSGCTGVSFNVDDGRCFLKPIDTYEACTEYEEVSNNLAARLI